MKKRVDAERFRKLASDPRRTRADLKGMAENAELLGRDDLAKIAVDILTARFGAKPKAKVRGRTPTAAMLHGERESFDTAKEAYQWMLSRLCEKYPSVFKFGEMGAVAFALATKRPYFARSLGNLYPAESAHLAEIKTNYSTLPNGLFADLNLSNAHKAVILRQLAAAAHLKDADWDWDPQP